MAQTHIGKVESKLELFGEPNFAIAAVAFVLIVGAHVGEQKANRLGELGNIVRKCKTK